MFVESAGKLVGANDWGKESAPQTVYEFERAYRYRRMHSFLVHGCKDASPKLLPVVLYAEPSVIQVKQVDTPSKLPPFHQPSPDGLDYDHYRLRGEPVSDDLVKYSYVIEGTGFTAEDLEDFLTGRMQRLGSSRRTWRAHCTITGATFSTVHMWIH